MHVNLKSAQSLTNWSARSISNTCIDTREILDKGEHDIINYRLWKKSLKLLTYSSRTQCLNF